MESDTEPRDEIVIVGPGRVGRSLLAAATSAGFSAVTVDRDELDGRPDLSGRVVILCVPDHAIPDVATRVGELTGANRPKRIGHVSGASGLGALEPAGVPARFSLHPLQTFPRPVASLAGIPAAITGSDPGTADAAKEFALELGMRPFSLADEDRAAYHAAASIASNFLIALEQTAAELLEEIGVEEPRRVLAPLVGASLANWTSEGPAALTGPIARGDEGTVAAHRAVLADRRPDLAGLYDALAVRTREIATRAGFPAVPTGDSRG